MSKIKEFFGIFRNKGVLLAAIAGVLGVLLATGVITPEQQEAIMKNAEYILGLFVAIGVVKAGKDAKDAQKRK